MTTIIVGNGPISNMGEFIDSHLVVIRMNSFKIAGHEADVGTRTTIWSFSVGNWPWIEKPLPRCDRVWAFYDKDRDKDRDEVAIGMEVWSNCLQSGSYDQIDSDGMDQYKQYIAKATGIKLNHISTGMRTICKAIRSPYLPISLVGFDGYAKGYHYYDDNPAKAARSQQAHDFEAEQKVLQALQDVGLVKIYD